MFFFVHGDFVKPHVQYRVGQGALGLIIFMFLCNFVNLCILAATGMRNQLRFNSRKWSNKREHERRKRAQKKHDKKVKLMKVKKANAYVRNASITIVPHDDPLTLKNVFEMAKNAADDEAG